MPELPEVETIKRGLTDVLPGKRLENLIITKPKMWQGRPASELYGQTVKVLNRVAKILIIHWSNNLSLLIHLKMTGQLIFVDSAGHSIAGGHPDDQFLVTQPSKYTHIIFHFEGGSNLYFNDMRQFGYAKLMSTDKLHDHSQIATIGVDPFSHEFSDVFLLEVLRKRPKTTVKQVLMDQTVIAGLGNIYTDESLFDAKILPNRKAASISKNEAKQLCQSIIKILDMGIRFGGTSYKDYVHHNGKKGTMQDHLQVYRRHGQPCKRCGTVIKRTVVGGRGTHFCPKCQV